MCSFQDFCDFDLDQVEFEAEVVEVLPDFQWLVEVKDEQFNVPVVPQKSFHRGQVLSQDIVQCVCHYSKYTCFLALVYDVEFNVFQFVLFICQTIFSSI